MTHSRLRLTGSPYTVWTIAKITSVGRKRMNELITDEIGSSMRGNAVLRMSLPPWTTDFDPWRTESWTNWNANRQPIRWANEFGAWRPWRRMSTRMK